MWFCSKPHIFSNSSGIVYSFIFLQNAQLAVTGINALVYADAKMEPLAIVIMVLAHAALDTPADTVKKVFRIFLNEQQH